MIRNGGPPLIASLVLFTVFFSNVALGAARLGTFLGDLAQMLTLFAAAILFVVGVLARETAAKRLAKKSDSQKTREEMP